ncbi:MAG TPA: PepSY domain-containing protein [Stenotrophomonas sp.]|nr:PepSY domain-containing protein [Stenotrophomonas sp.]
MRATPLTRTPLLLALGLASLGFAAGAAAKPPAEQGSPKALTSTEITAMLSAQGYRDVHEHDVEFEDGVWKADAKSGDGKHVDLKVDPATGRVYPDEMASPMSEDDVRAALSAAGYSDARDLDFDDGLWKGHAQNAAGKDMKVQVDPKDGKVVAAERD